MHKVFPSSDNKGRSDTEDAAVNAEFTGPKSGHKNKPFKGNKDGLSQLDRILGSSFQTHSTQDKPATHTNMNCWFFK